MNGFGKRTLRNPQRVHIALISALSMPATIAGLVPSAAAGPAAKRPVGAEFRADGTVRAFGKTFPTIPAYVKSSEFRAAGGRCGRDQQRPPMPQFAPADCGLSSTTIDGAYAPEGGTIVIPVVFHVISRTNGVGDLSDDLIKSQVAVLNEDYNATPGTMGALGSPAAIQFVLATTDPDGQPTTGIERVVSNAFFTDPGYTGSASAMKQALAWDPSRYLNIYTNDAAGALGYATFPQEEAGDTNDGVVLLYSSVGRNAPNGAPYDLGRTATHEIGHWLGLYHTFQDGCGSSASPYSTGDLISDTPAESHENYDCTPVKMCGGQQAPIENYMEYTEDACMTNFTAEQVNRMRCSVLHYRPGMASLANQPPTARFTYVPADLAVAFASTSTDVDGTIATMAWAFGDGGTGSGIAVNHTYGQGGTYDVTLTVTDNKGATASVTQAVEVVAPVVVDPPDDPPSVTNPGQEDGDGSGCGCRGGGTLPSAGATVMIALWFLRRRR